MTRKVLCDFLVASCVPDGGVFRYRLYEDATIEQIMQIPMPSPMFLQLQKDRLWAVLRAPFKESKESGVAMYDLQTGNRLTDIISTKGEVACHLAADGNDIYCANYISGSVFKAPALLDIHSGHGTDPVRQEAPHVHSVFFSPDKQYVLSCDLGLDTVFVYDRNLHPVCRAKVPDGAGARHLCFSKDGRYVYCVNEMGATISVFSYEDGKLNYLHSVSVKPKDYEGIGKGAAIVLSQDGQRLYVTERGSQTVALLEANGEKLSAPRHFACGGSEPRDFALIANEQFAVCTNQFSNHISLFQVSSNGGLTHIRDISIQAPLCIVEIQNS